MEAEPSLSVVVPAYNEAGRIAEGISRIEAALASTGLIARTRELIVVDDGSTDGTSAAVSGLANLAVPITLVKLPENRGKGAAVRAGVARATGDLTCFIDADASIDPLHLADLVAALRHAPVAVGDRSSGGRAIAYRSWLRSAMGRIFNAFVRITSGVAVVDTQCGCKGFTTSAGKLLLGFGRIDGFAFDVELLRHARLLGLEVATVPVAWSDVEGSHVRRLLDPVAMVAALVGSRLGERRRCILARSDRQRPPAKPGTVALRSEDRWFTCYPLAPQGDPDLEGATPLSLRWLARHGLDEIL